MAPIDSEQPVNQYGRRLILTVFEARARTGHHRPYASIPVSGDVKDGYRDISYGVFVNAVNRCALWLIENIGLSSDFETMVYVGPNDFRYQILCLAATKTGRVMFFPSPRNSVEAFMSMFRDASITKFIAPAKAFPYVEPIVQKRSMQRLVIPELDALLDESPVPCVPFEKSFDEYRLKPWIVLHTSGSTGTPKLITLRHGYPTTMDAAHNFDTGLEVVQRLGNMRVFNSFPPFHMAGITFSLAIVLWVDSTAIMPPPGLLSAEVADHVHRIANVESSALPPSVIVDLAKNSDYLQRLVGMKSMTTGGGPLPTKIGDLVSKYVPLNSTYASTEIFYPPVHPKKREHWGYLHLDLEGSGGVFRPADGGLYELVIVRNSELDLYQAAFITFPDLQEYHTKDLFSPHPTEGGLWRYEGRLDDIIVLSSGEKFNPVTMESIITACPDVKGCLVVGHGKFQSALLLELDPPRGTDADISQSVEAVWPYVQRANESSIAHGRVARDMILCTSPDKPLARSGKGTVQRQRSVTMYKEEIDAFYGSTHASKTARTQNMDLHDLESSKKSLEQFIGGEMGLGRIGCEEDFFLYGMDSVQLMGLVRAINSSLDGPPIEAKQVYENPTIEQLARSLHSDAHHLRDDDDDLETWIKMQQIFWENAWSIPEKTTPVLTTRRLMRGRKRDRIFDSVTKHTYTEKDAVLHVEKQANGDNSSIPSYNASSDKEFLISMVPPDRGMLAWLQVLASFLINLNNWGLINSFGAFQAFYQANYLADYSPSAISWIGTVQASLLLITGVVSGMLFDKGYFKIILTAASITLVFALIMLSLARHYYSIMLCQGILLGLSCGLLYIPSVALIPLYFKDRRGLALGLATSGASIGGIVYPIIFRRLLDELGFGWATRIIAFIALATLTVATLITRPFQMRKPGRELLQLAAVKELPFATFMLSAFLAFCAFLVPFFLTPTFAAFHGASTNLSFYLLAVINTGQFFGRIIPAALSDPYGGEVPIVIAELLAGILSLCWIGVHNVGGLVVFLLLYGFVSGMIATLPAVVVPYVCPSLAVLGTRLGMVYGSAGVGALIGVPVALAASQTEEDRYLGAQLWTGLCFLVGAAVFVPTFVAARRQRRNGERKGRVGI